jgi:hypothetical protein
VPLGSRCDGGEGVVLPVMMATEGALQRGHGAVVLQMEAGHACKEVRLSGGVNNPDVCGLWF